MAQSKKKYALSIARWLLLLPIPAIWCALAHFGLLDFFENRTIDWRFQNRGEIAAPINIVYVDVDSRSLEDIGNFPWDRSHFAAVARALVDVGKVKAVGFDFLLSDLGIPEVADPNKVKTGNKNISSFLGLQRQPPPPVVMAASYSAQQFRPGEGGEAVRGLPILANETRPTEKIDPPEKTSFKFGLIDYSPSNIGLIDTYYGGTRTVPVWVPTNTGIYYSMALELARLYWGLPPGSIKVAADHIEFVRPDGTLQTTVPMRDHQLVDVNWFSAWESEFNPRIGFNIADVFAKDLDSKDEKDKKDAEEFFAQFKDAVVLIGPTDLLLQDVATTSMDDKLVPRVGVHGNLLKTIVSGIYLKQLSEPMVVGIVFGLTIIISIFAASGGTGGLRAKLTAALMLTAYVYFAFWLFKQQHLVIPMTAPIGSILTTTIGAIIWQLVEEERQKGRIKGMFGAYVSPQLVSRMVESGEDPQLGGHESEITAYFSDIQSFSSFSEKLPPARLVELMNQYLTACTDILQKEGGTLDKYIGDAVVVMFGAPVPLADHAYRACVASQLVHRKLAELREQWKGEGDKWPDIVAKMQSRIGLNSGPAIIGNMGSRTRFNYTMMGDNVNLAARMESGAKSWGAYTMVTEATRVKCVEHGKDRVVFRQLGRIQVMGRSQAVPIFEIVGLKEFVEPSALECISIFERGLAHYYAREWDAAIQQFKRSAELEPNQPGRTPGVKLNPSLVYLNITEDYRAEPPSPDWDGVFVMKEK